jgi:phage gp37-like protein
MSVIADVYNGLVTRLSSVTGVNTVELFNSQYDNEQRERVTKYPAVYIEFSNISWQMSSHMVARNIKKTVDIGNLTQQQKGNMEITIHLAYKSLKNESDSFAEIDAIRHNIYKSLSNYMITTETTGLQRQSDIQDPNHDGVVVWKTIYTLSVEEKAWNDTGIVEANAETETPPITLDLDIELDIDNSKIRTGDGK